jgi:rubrerythrin
MDIVQKVLINNIHHEEEAIKEYHHAIQVAKKKGLSKLANRFSEIARDEMTHKKQLERELDNYNIKVKS